MAKKKRKNNNKPTQKIMTPSSLRRTNKATFLLNEKEKEAIELYCRKNKIRNKSKFMREALMRIVMDHFIEDYPTLFEKKDMDKIIV